MSPMQMIRSRALWDTVKQINSELKPLIPDLLSPTADPEKYSYGISSSFVAGAKISTNPVRGLLKTSLVILMESMDQK